MTERELLALRGRLCVLLGMSDELEAIGASQLRRTANAAEIAALQARLDHLGGVNGDLTDATARGDS
jgi:hypothetical protein